MAERSVQPKDEGSIPSAPLHIQEAKIRFKDDPEGLEAVARFEQDPTKCFQRHIREVRGERETRNSILTLENTVVESISNAEAAVFIRKYEWLRSMGAGTMECVGIKKDGELLGVECFGKAGREVGQICSGVSFEEISTLAKKTSYLMRGACAPWAPKKTGSYLIRQACKLLYKKRGWQIFFAYSDVAAGEVGIIYQRAHWHYLGTGLGKSKGAYHSDYLSPDGKTIWSSYKINHNRQKLMIQMGAPKDVPFRRWLKNTAGWTQIKRYSHDKGVYVWFEGTSEEVAYLKSRCRYLPFKPYPKRNQNDQSRIVR